jgi:hypothetical protein
MAFQYSTLTMLTLSIMQLKKPVPISESPSTTQPQEFQDGHTHLRSTGLIIFIAYLKLSNNFLQPCNSPALPTAVSEFLRASQTVDVRRKKSSQCWQTDPDVPLFRPRQLCCGRCNFMLRRRRGHRCADFNNSLRDTLDNDNHNNNDNHNDNHNDNDNNIHNNNASNAYRSPC